MAISKQRHHVELDEIDSTPTILSPEESRKHFDAQVQYWLGISGEEFLRRWDAGEYRDVSCADEEGRTIQYLWMLIPLARPNS